MRQHLWKLCSLVGMCFLVSSKLAECAPIEEVELSPIIVTANRSPQSKTQAKSNLTAITAEDIARAPAQTIPDVLKTQMGINVYDSGTTKTTTVDIRGFGDTANRNVLVLVNGRKVNPADISGPDWSHIPLESVERIEVLRGAGTVLYGDNAVGGVINIVTKKGGEPFVKVEQTLGSYESGSIALEAADRRNDLGMYIYSKYDDQGGYRDNSDLLSKDFFTQWDYQISDKVALSMDAGWHKDDYELPGGLNDTELDLLGRRGSADSTDFASSKDRYIQGIFDLVPFTEELGHWETAISKRNRDVYSVFNSFGQFATRNDIDTIALNTKYIYDQPVDDRDLNIVGGVDYYTVDNRILGSGTNTDDVLISKDEVGAYIFSEYEFINQWSVNGGIRRQKADYTFRNRGGFPSKTTKSPHETASSVGVKYQYAEKSNLFFNVSETFRFLATDEWYSTWSGLNTDLRHQTGIQYEAGIKHNFYDAVEVSLTPYLIRIEDEIFFDPTAGGGFGANSNYESPTRRLGFEVGQTTDVLKFVQVPVDRLSMFTNYTYQNAEFLAGVNDGKTIPLVADHQASAGFNVGMFKFYNWNVTGRYIGSRYAINDIANATDKIHQNFVLDTKLSYDRANWGLFAAINNVLNEKYYSYVTKSASSNVKDHFPAPERNFMVGMNVKF